MLQIGQFALSHWGSVPGEEVGGEGLDTGICFVSNHRWHVLVSLVYCHLIASRGGGDSLQDPARAEFLFPLLLRIR